ncbi:MAG: lipoprotein LprG, partial [Mycobacterium sp.]|nr:lipoprotein LprG [Mycobacterium sp.]
GQTGQTGRSAVPDASTLLAQSAQSMRLLKSAHLVQSVTGKVPGVPIKVMTGDLTTSPAPAATGQETITVAGSDINTSFVVLDGELYTDALGNKWSDFGKASDIYDPTAILNPGHRPG